MSSNRKRNVVLVGAGHAHILVLEAFAATPLDGVSLTVLVDEPIAMYSGMVPGFVAGQYRQGQLEIDARPLATAAGAEVVVGQAAWIDAKRNLIHIESGDSIPFDLASINIGSTVAGRDLPGVLDHALPTRPITSFVRRFEDVIEKAKCHESAEPFRLVVVGGGAGGVELAFTAQHRLKQELDQRIEVTLLHDGPEILGNNSPAMISRIRRWAEKRDLRIQCERRVVEVEAQCLRFKSGDNVPFDALLWVTGPVSHPFFTKSRLPTDERGFAKIRSTLQLQDHDHVFAVGDCATFIESPDTPKAGVYAVREGPYITRNLRSMLAGETLATYSPQHDFLTLMNLGGGIAVGGKWGWTFEGKWVMKWKDHIDRKFMRRFQHAGR